jgi:hypothetical protein
MINSREAKATEYAINTFDVYENFEEFKKALKQKILDSKVGEQIEYSISCGGTTTQKYGGYKHTTKKYYIDIYADVIEVEGNIGKAVVNEMREANSEKSI